MSSVPADGKVAIAVEFLSRAADDLSRAKRTRLAYVKASKTHGLTNKQIGDALGISEARVRQMLSRAE